MMRLIVASIVLLPMVSYMIRLMAVLVPLVIWTFRARLMMIKLLITILECILSVMLGLKVVIRPMKNCTPLI